MVLECAWPLSATMHRHHSLFSSDGRCWCILLGTLPGTRTSCRPARNCQLKQIVPHRGPLYAASSHQGDSQIWSSQQFLHVQSYPNSRMFPPSVMTTCLTDLLTQLTPILAPRQYGTNLPHYRCSLVGLMPLYDPRLVW